MLNPQGRFLYDFFIFEKENNLYLDCFCEYTQQIIHKLNIYKLTADVNIELSELNVYVVFDYKAQIGDFLSFIDPRAKALGTRLYTFNKNIKEDFKAYEIKRIQNGIPDVPYDLIYQKSIILECNLQYFNAISFTKGCYIGQELIARTYHQGLLRKRLLPLKIQEGTVDYDEPIFYNEQIIGYIRSHTQDMTLGLIRFVDLPQPTPILKTEHAKLHIFGDF